MDGRIALTPGTVLKLSTKTGYTEYTIARELARGGSCIVYDASYTDNLGNYKLVRIKECYPYALKMVRDEAGSLSPSARDGVAFDAAKRRLIAAYQKNHELFSLDGRTNSIANTSGIYEANGTVYIVSVYMTGAPLQSIRAIRCTIAYLCLSAQRKHCSAFTTPDTYIWI